MRVKDWQKFQHYKERSPPWIKLHKMLLDDPDWHGLDPVAAKALVMIWLIASESDGVLPDERKLAFRLRVSGKELVSILKQLEHWLEHDASASLASCTLETEEETETEGEAERAPARPTGRQRRKPETALAVDWKPEVNTRARIASLGLGESDQNRELLKFRNHAQQNDRRCRDWDAAFANWCLKALEFMGRTPAVDEAGERPKAQSFAVTAGSPEWDSWRAHYRDQNQRVAIKLMDEAADRCKPFTVPSQWPPNRSAA